MDIEKDSNREAFEAYMAEKYKNLMDRRKCLNNGGGYMAWDMNVAWQVWQAAKEHEANKLGQETLTHYRLQELIAIGVKAALEEREQSHESK